MSMLEMELRRIGVWDTVLEECSKTGQTVAEYISGILSSALKSCEQDVQCESTSYSDDSLIKVSHSDEFISLLKSGLDVEAIEQDMRRHGIDPELSKTEARDIWEL